MSAHARNQVTDSFTHAANDDCINGGPCTRTKYSYDTAGHTSGYGSVGFTYNDRGRMIATSASSTDYLYNALGQMIEKSGTGGTTVFMQDESGHLLGEYNGSGSLIEETVWLGDIPVATLPPNGSGGVNIFYVHSDHLNAPRKVAQPITGTLAWRWDTDPFGTAAPNQNPAGLGAFAYNLRFPGQYYDSETGLNQNWNRVYDPIVGRYVESDPLGLRAGINTYLYVRANPISNADPTGLLVQGWGWNGPLADMDWPDVKAAEAKLRSVLSGSCSCHKDGSSGSCVPCDVAGSLLARLNDTVVNYRIVLPQHACGSAPLGGTWLTLSSRAFGSGSCSGCLASTIYHEMLHDIGWAHPGPADPNAYDPVNAAEEACFGDLCGQSNSVPVSIIH